MNLPTTFFLIFTAFFPTFAVALLQTADIYLQPLVSPANPLTPPTHLATLNYDPSDPAAATISTYNAPILPEDTDLVRIGVASLKSGSEVPEWTSSTTVAGVENFEKGFSPSVILSVDGKGVVLGATFKGVRVDAGMTRDVRPRAVLLVSGTGKEPELNRAVVVTAKGGKQVVEEEKTFLQKYWMFILAGVIMLMAGGGDGK